MEHKTTKPVLGRDWSGWSVEWDDARLLSWDNADQKPTADGVRADLVEAGVEHTNDQDEVLILLARNDLIDTDGSEIPCLLANEAISEAIVTLQAAGWEVTDGDRDSTTLEKDGAQITVEFA